MPSKNSGGSTKFPGGRKVINGTAQTAFVRVVTPRKRGLLVPTNNTKGILDNLSWGVRIAG